MKFANEFRYELNQMLKEMFDHYSELIKHKNPIVFCDVNLDSDDYLTVNGSVIGIPYDVYPLMATDDGIEVCEVGNVRNKYKIYFGNLNSIEDKLRLLELMEYELTTIKTLGNIKEVRGEIDPNEI